MGIWAVTSALVQRAATGVLTGVNPEGAGWRLLSGVFPGAVGPPPKRGTQSFLDAYSRQPLLRAVVQRIAHSIAATEWTLSVPTSGSTRDQARVAKAICRMEPEARHKAVRARRASQELRPVETHEVLDLLDLGNAFQTGVEMWVSTAASMELVGESYWLKERGPSGKGKPIAIWPVPASWVMTTPTPAHPFFRISYRGWQAEIPQTEFLWFRDPDPANPYARGSAVAASVGDELQADEYAAKMLGQHFLNRARPDFIITSPDFSEPEVRRLEADWLNQHQGFWRSWKPRFMNREIQVHEMGADMRAGQFVQIREHQRDLVLHTWGIPPEILGVVENSNRATIYGAETIYGRFVIIPRLELIRSVLQERLLPEFDERLILDYVSPVERDAEHALAVMSAFPSGFTLDEWRGLAGYDPLDDKKGRVFLLADGHYVEAHPVMAEEDAKSLAAAAPDPLAMMQAEAEIAANAKPPVVAGAPGVPAKPAPKPDAAADPDKEKPEKAYDPDPVPWRFVPVRRIADGRTGMMVLGPDDVLPADVEPIPVEAA